MFFEQAREEAEADWKKNKKDARALTRWGGALLELAHFQQGPQAVELIEKSVGKFREAVAVNPQIHEAHWCLGNALTSKGFLHPDIEVAQGFFDQAKEAFQTAVDLDGENPVYNKALQLTEKAPTLHAELQRQLAGQGDGGAALGGAGGGGAAGTAAKTAAGADDEWYYPYVGWGVLVALCVSYSVWAKATAPK